MPTQLKSRCPRCQVTVKVSEAQVGKRVRCQACRQPFELSSVQAASDSDSLAGAPSASETMAATGDTQPSVDVGRSHQSNSPQRALGKLGRFELKELLGQGSFGRVYRAYDPQLDRFVALKVPTFGPQDTHKIQRFIAEAKAAAKLRHPNIVPTYESGQADGQYYIAAQFVAGQPLSKRIKSSPLAPQGTDASNDPSTPDSSSPPITFRQAAEYVRQLADALAYAHTAGIVHRDIKPDNIMLGEDDIPQVMDFGLAKRVNEDAGMTTDGSILGTPAYMAPEQARGDHKNVGPASDQYSLGVVLYQLLTGQRPFSGPPHSVIAQVIAQEPPTLRSFNNGIPSDLEAICQIAMNKTIGERYATCSDLSADLARWLGGFETLASPLTPSQRAWRWCRRNALVAGLLATVALLLTFGLAASATVWLMLASKPAPEMSLPPDRNQPSDRSTPQAKVTAASSEGSIKPGPEPPAEVIPHSIAAADEGGFVRLDNGKDLAGWKGDARYWSVKDGAITAKTTLGSRLKYNTCLIWEGGQPGDFELTLKYKIAGGNSGVQYRSTVIDQAKFIVSGYQADIDSTPKFTGINYEEGARAILAQRGEKVTIDAAGKKEIEKFGDPAALQTKIKIEDWNDCRIVAKGNHLQHYINGELMSEVIDNQKDKTATSGVIALQAHRDFAMTVQFKDIRLKEDK